MKAIKFIAPDRAGLLVEISEVLALHGINILEIEGKTVDRQAVMALMADRPDEAMHLLLEQGFQAVSDELITIRIADQPGALAKVTRELSDARLSIRGISTLQRRDGYCFVALSTDDDAAARRLLEASLL